MNWIRAHYDQVALIAAAAFLYVCSISIWCSAVGFGKNFAVIPTRAPLKGASPLAKAVELGAAAQKLNQPPQWTFTGLSGQFVPDELFIVTYGLAAPLMPPILHPPVRT